MFLSSGKKLRVKPHAYSDTWVSPGFTFISDVSFAGGRLSFWMAAAQMQTMRRVFNAQEQHRSYLASVRLDYIRSVYIARSVCPVTYSISPKEGTQSGSCYSLHTYYDQVSAICQLAIISSVNYAQPGNQTHKNQEQIHTKFTLKQLIPVDKNTKTNKSWT